jgi:hypothetical protein
VLPVVLGAAVAVPAMPRHLAQAWVPDRNAVAIVCSGTAPTLCIARADTRLLDELRAPARKAVAILAEKLPPAPTRVVLYTVEGAGPPAGPRPADTLMASLGRDEFDLLVGAGTWPCPDISAKRGNDAARYIAARYAVAHWLTGERISIPDVKKGDALLALAEQVAEVLRALPPDEQRARVNAFRTAELSCTRGDRLDILAGPGRIR